MWSWVYIYRESVTCSLAAVECWLSNQAQRVFSHYEWETKDDVRLPTSKYKRNKTSDMMGLCGILLTQKVFDHLRPQDLGRRSSSAGGSASILYLSLISIVVDGHEGALNLWNPKQKPTNPPSHARTNKCKWVSPMSMSRPRKHTILIWWTVEQVQAGMIGRGDAKHSTLIQAEIPRWSACSGAPNICHHISRMYRLLHWTKYPTTVTVHLSEIESRMSDNFYWKALLISTSRLSNCRQMTKKIHGSIEIHRMIRFSTSSGSSGTLRRSPSNASPPDNR